MPGPSPSPPKDDTGYSDTMSRATFAAGLNWKTVENVWSNCGDAFIGFSTAKVAKFGSKDVQTLMKGTGIIRNETKVRTTIQNVGTVLDLQGGHRSFCAYNENFGKNEKVLQEELRRRFKFMGTSTARTLLWMVGYELTPAQQKRERLKSHPEHR